MKVACRRCGELNVDAIHYSYAPLTPKEMDTLSYCDNCWKIAVFENNKFVRCPYKIPINRRGIGEEYDRRRKE